MSKLIIEKIHDKKTYGKDMYKVVKLIDSDRLSLLNTQFDEPSMLRYLKSITSNLQVRDQAVLLGLNFSLA